MQRHQCTLTLISLHSWNGSTGRRTHYTLISYISITFQVEQDRHIILVVRSVKTRDVDERASQAIPKVLSVECWLPIICEVYRLSGIVCRLYVLLVLGEGEVDEREEGHE